MSDVDATPDLQEQAPVDTEVAPEAAEGDAVENLRTQFEKDQAQGFIGIKVDPLPNEAHSLESGPDSPALPAPDVRVEQHVIREEVKDHG